MADISKEMAVQLAREAACPEGFIGSLILEQPHVAWIRAVIEASAKLGRNAGLEEAKLACGEVEKHPSLGARHCIEAIESLKDNTP